MKKLFAILACAIVAANGLAAESSLKVICASRASTPPVIDGLLDDACWQATEVRRDFVPPTDDPAPLTRSTEARVVFDSENLYIGLKFHWDDISLLEKGLQSLKSAAAEPRPKGVKGYVNQYGVELFVDPDATGFKYYQILFNAAGQMTGHYMMRWDLFDGRPSFKAAIKDGCWTAEFVYPFKGLKLGGEWGLNICRNDETYYSIWKPMGTVYNDPRNFGRLVMGDYQQWWDAVWSQGAAKKLETMRPFVEKHAADEPGLSNLYAQTAGKAEKLSRVAAANPPNCRGNFETLYKLNAEFQNDFRRLDSLYRTLRLTYR